MNLVIEKGAVVVLTDSQITAFQNITAKKGAVLVAVPDNASTEERLSAAERFKHEGPAT